MADRAEKAVRRSYEAGDINAPELSLQLRRLLEIRQEELEVRYLHVQLRTRLGRVDRLSVYRSRIMIEAT